MHSEYIFLNVTFSKIFNELFDIMIVETVMKKH
jgi:hypothetical protein